MNLAGLTNGLGSPFLAPRGLPITARPIPASRRSDTVLVTRALMMRVIGVLLLLSALSATAMLLAFYPAVAAGDVAQGELARNIGFGAGVLALSLAALTAFFRWHAGWAAPLYALTSGVFMAGLSLGFEREFPGIALQTLAVTAAVFLSLWSLHGAGVIRVGRRLMVLTFAATGAIALVYLLSFLLRLGGMSVPVIHDAGAGGILWTGFIVVVAALNLLIDFERIAQMEGRTQPRYMPWFVGLGVMVTLVWLYISVLRLLAKIRR